MSFDILAANLLLALPAAAPDVPPFTDATTDAGLTHIHASAAIPVEHHQMLPGVGVGDFDRDGFLDVVVPGGEGQNLALFLNDGDGAFTNRADAWGIDLVAAEGAGVAIGDVNGDGWLDFYVGVIGGPNALLMNDAGAGFVDAGPTSGAVLTGDGDPFATYGAAFGDVDGDGDLDLVTADWSFFGPHGDRLFINDGTGTFTDATAAAGLFDGAGAIRGFVPAVVDLDGDRAPEVTVTADFSSSRYYANIGVRNGPATFGRVEDNGTCTDENGMGAAFADVDGDGDLDWFVTSIFDDDGESEGNWGVSGNRLYRNDGDHQFTDVTDLAGVRNGDWGWGNAFGDLNHDGHLDLVMTNGFALADDDIPDPTFLDDPTRLWLRDGTPGADPWFVESAAAAGVVHTGQGRGLALFDADNDGDLDLVIAENHGPLAFYRNDLDPAPDRWLALELLPPPGCAPDGVGATVEVTAGDVTMHRAAIRAPSTMSAGPGRIHLGFPAASAVDVVVRWPDGTITGLPAEKPGRVRRVRARDMDGDLVVGASDLQALLARWGRCDGRGPCAGDFDGDDRVGLSDLLLMLLGWG